MFSTLESFLKLASLFDFHEFSCITDDNSFQYNMSYGLTIVYRRQQNSKLFSLLVHIMYVREKKKDFK
jgi:hypothetical protein